MPRATPWVCGSDPIHYDYLIIVTGPRLAFEEVEGAVPSFSNSICTIDHTEKTYQDIKNC